MRLLEIALATALNLFSSTRAQEDIRAVCTVPSLSRNAPLISHELVQFLQRSATDPIPDVSIISTLRRCPPNTIHTISIFDENLMGKPCEGLSLVTLYQNERTDATGASDQQATYSSNYISLTRGLQQYKKDSIVGKWMLTTNSSGDYSMCCQILCQSDRDDQCDSEFPQFSQP